MGFDPDKYLQSKQAGQSTGFDPDKYLANRSIQSQAVNDGPSNSLDEGSKSFPIKSDIFNDSDRLKYSFGDDAGRESHLRKSGYSEIGRDDSGNIIAKGKDGKWYRDQDDLLSNPINYLETAAGKALPLAGNIAGGLAGAVYGAGVGAIPGAGAGAAAGEGARIAIGKALGAYEGDGTEIAKDVAKEGVLGAVSEGGAQLLTKKALPYLSEKLRPEKLLSAFKSASKPNASEIEAATKALPGNPKATVGQLAASKQAQDLESTLYKSPTLGGSLSRENIDPVVKGMESAASDIVSDGSHTLDPFVSGQSAKDSIGKTVSDRIEPLKAQYNELDPFFESAKPSNRSLLNVKKTIEELRRTPGLSDTEGLLSEIEKDISKVDSIQGIRDTITGLGRKLSPTSSANQKHVVSILRDALQSAKENSIELATRDVKYGFDKVPTGLKVGEATNVDAVELALAKGRPVIKEPVDDVVVSVWDKLLDKKGKDGFTKIGNFNVNSIDGVAYVYDATKTKQLAKVPEKDLMSWAQANDDGSFYRFFKRNKLDAEKIITKNPEISEKLSSADKGFASVANDIQSSLPFKINPKQGVQSQLTNSLDSIPNEKLGSILWDKNDIASLKSLQNLDPKAFDILRRQEVSRILKAPGVFKDGKVIPGALTRHLSKYNPEALNLLLGEEKAALSGHLKTVAESMPQVINPSGTDVRGETRGFLGTLFSPKQNAESYLQHLRLKMMAPNAAPRQSLLDNAVIQKIKSNPQLINAIANPELRSLIESRSGISLPKVASDTTPIDENIANASNGSARRPQSLDKMDMPGEAQKRFIEAQ